MHLADRLTQRPHEARKRRNGEAIDCFTRYSFLSVALRSLGYTVSLEPSCDRELHFLTGRRNQRIASTSSKLHGMNCSTLRTSSGTSSMSPRCFWQDECLIRHGERQPFSFNPPRQARPRSVISPFIATSRRTARSDISATRPWRSQACDGPPLVSHPRTWM